MVHHAPIPAEALAGVHRGDPEAMAELCGSRGGSVLAFCEAACGVTLAPRAAAEAFARFRAAVAAAPEGEIQYADGLLLGATRHAAASLAPVPPTAGGRLLGRGRRRGAEVHAVVPTLLAARAEGGLGQADQDRLARHLERCAPCRETEERFADAEERYAEASGDPPPPELVRALVTSMAAAAPAAAAGLGADGHPEVDEPGDGPQTPPPAAGAGEDEGVDEDLRIGTPPLGPVGVVAVAPDPELDGILDDPSAAGDLDDPDDFAMEHDDDHDDADPDDPGAQRAPIAIRGHPEATAPATAKAGGRLGRPVALILPLAVILMGVLAAMAVAGVFGGDDGQPARSGVDPPQIETVREPVTTPLTDDGVLAAAPVRKRKRSSRRRAKPSAKRTADSRSASPAATSTTPSVTVPVAPTPTELQDAPEPAPQPVAPAPKKQQSATKVPSGGGGAQPDEPASEPTPTFEPAPAAP